MFSSSAFKETSQSSFYQQQTIYDLNTLLSESSTATYGVDNFDLSLLGNDYQFDSYQQLKLDDALSIEIDSNYQYPSQLTQLKQEDLNDWPSSQQQQQYYSQLISPISPATTTYSSPSPCPSIEQHFTVIKQEQQIVLPPSPPDSNGVPSPQSIHHCENFKVEQFDESVLSPSAGENFIDINYLLDSSDKKPQQDHQVLRGFLQDTTFQRKHNLKPLPLENLFGGLTQRGDIEPVISLALQHAKQEVQATCNALKISPNPLEWTEQQVQLWINSTVKQFKLEAIPKCETIFPENGQMLAMLSDEDFIRRAPQIGSILHAQLEIWKAAYVDVSNNSNSGDNNSTTLTSSGSSAVPTMNSASLSQTSIWNQMLNDDSDMSDDDDSDVGMEIDLQTSSPAAVSASVATVDGCEGGESSASSAQPTTTKTTKTPKKHHTHLQKKGSGAQSSHIHLWQFLKELLASPQLHGTAIRWLDRSKGIFKIEDSVRVARLWGTRKNRPAMNYDKLSRSIRQYYKKGIMKKTERSQRLVYQFCHPYSL
ncbi:hypothetical protein PVAND_007083 [Polypedilum vanderplanki]|uniref:DNA-binding protein D-ETS-4 n=1 Tax=Polypedilum vanderplanki TaxID=319348 RepID=A0A9J6C5L4_POLVA|nr:hypothetical protein PVAND_007083 [Polypedilum vanderplanki]